MARTIEEILQEIDARAAEHPQLEGLESNASAAQVWRAAKQVMALGMAQVEHAIDALKAEEVDARISRDEPGGVEWYRQKALEYQHGHQLAIRDNRPGYLSLDEAARIVRHVSVVEASSDGALQVKAAGNDGSNIAPLTHDQRAGLRAYLERVKIAGTLIQVTSATPEQVAYSITAEIDPSVLDAEAAQMALFKTLDSYHKALDFNHTLYLSKATDAMQAVEGILDVEIAQARYLKDATWSVINRKYDPPAGYVQLNEERSEVTIALMYLIDYDTFIRQALPPHWRDQWQQHLIAALCAPLKQAFDETYKLKCHAEEQAHLNLQTMSFEQSLNIINGYNNREIALSDGDSNGTIRIITPDVPVVKARIRKHFEQVKVAGEKIELSLYNLQ